MIICQRLLNGRETDVTQIRSNSWIERLYLRSILPFHILLIVALLHINKIMLTCNTIREKDSWQNDWSQGFRLCDQEEWPNCDTCVKVPYQSHIWYTECGSTSAVLLTHYCWVQMYGTCVWGYWHHAAIPETISRKCHTGMSTIFKYSNPPGCQLHLWWRCSDPQNSTKNWADLWVSVAWKVYWICKKKKNMTNQRSVWWLPRWSFHKRQFSSEMEEIIRQ